MMTAELDRATALQVKAEHYRPAHYDKFHRWVSYWYQIQSVIRSGARSLLEIGVGSGVVSSYLRSRLGIAVTTCDFDPSLKPDLVGDVRHLDEVLAENSFEGVVAFQVLEHLPFSEFAPALQQMARASSDAVLISLPHYGYNFQFRIRLKKWNWVFGRKITRSPEWSFDGQHHWEIGTRGYPLSRVRETVAGFLKIQREYFCPDYPYHYFFECTKIARG